MGTSWQVLHAFEWAEKKGGREDEVEDSSNDFLFRDPICF